jgi:hypothetical protein
LLGTNVTRHFSKTPQQIRGNFSFRGMSSNTQGGDNQRIEIGLFSGFVRLGPGMQKSADRAVYLGNPHPVGIEIGFAQTE